MFVQTLINVRRHSHSPLAVARGSSRPYTAVPTPSHRSPHVLCVQPEALKKGKSAAPGRGPASGFGSTNSGSGGGGGGKPGGGGGGGGNIRGACCAPTLHCPPPHCATAAAITTTAVSPCLARACAGMGTLKGAAPPARTGPRRTSPRPAPRTSAHCISPPPHTLGAPACTLRVCCIHAACSSGIPPSMYTAYHCIHAYMRAHCMLQVAAGCRRWAAEARRARVIADCKGKPSDLLALTIATRAALSCFAR